MLGDVEKCTLFTGLGKTLTDIMHSVSEDALQPITNGLSAMMSAILLAYIIYSGYQMVNGKGGQAPVREGTIDISYKIIFLIIATSYPTYIREITSAMMDLNNFFGGGGNRNIPTAGLYTKLDNMVDLFNTGALKVYKQGDMITGAISALIVYAGFVLAFVPVFLIVIGTTITLSILTMTLPLAIISLMFKTTKNIFIQWLNLFIANLLTVLFLAIVFSAMMSISDKYLNGMTNASVKNVWLMAGGYCGIGLVLSKITHLVKEFATKLAQSSLEHMSGKMVAHSLATASSPFLKATKGATHIGLGAIGKTTDGSLDNLGGKVLQNIGDTMSGGATMVGSKLRNIVKNGINGR